MITAEGVRVTIDPAQVSRVVGGHAAASTRRAAQVTRERIQSNIRALGRVDTGEMLNSWRITEPSDGLHPRSTIYSTAEHTGYQERGTRAHGPRTAPRLVFTPKGTNTIVFAKWVSGVTPGRFVENAFQRLSVSDFAR